MSAYKTLHAVIECPACGNRSEQVLQFKFGETRQHKYAIGDKLRWGHNNVGRPGLTRVEVSAVTEACPVCNTSGQDFVVTIEDDTITGVERAPKAPPPVTDGELYQVIEE